MAKINAPVYLQTSDGAVFYAEGDDVAEEHLPLLGDHLFDEGKPEPEQENEPDEKPGDKVERLKAELAEAEAELAKASEEAVAKAKADEEAKAKADAESTQGQKLERPDGRAGAAKWLAYAEQEGITVPESDREDKAAIVTLVEAHEAQAQA